MLTCCVLALWMSSLAQFDPSSTGELRFVVTQDQRNTIGGRVMYHAGRASLALSAAYGSGLPVEFEGSEKEAIEQFGSRVVDQVDFERGRVRPFLTFDASTAFALTGSKNLRIQADVQNLTNRLRVINFAGVFSGTAIAPPLNRLRTPDSGLQAGSLKPEALSLFRTRR